MEFEKYRHSKPYPVVPHRPLLSINNRPTSAQARKFADDLDAYERELISYKSSITAYRLEDTILFSRFKTDLIDELGIKYHTKAECLFQMAWDRCHSEGYEAVYNEADTLAALLRA